jgi:hypothetical protein
MKEHPTVKEMDDLYNELSDLGFEIGTIACRAHLLEDKADELTGALEDICREIKGYEEEEGDEE